MAETNGSKHYETDLYKLSEVYYPDRGTPKNVYADATKRIAPLIDDFKQHYIKHNPFPDLAHNELKPELEKAFKAFEVIADELQVAGAYATAKALMDVSKSENVNDYMKSDAYYHTSHGELKSFFGQLSAIPQERLNQVIAESEYLQQFSPLIKRFANEERSKASKEGLDARKAAKKLQDSHRFKAPDDDSKELTAKGLLPYRNDPKYCHQANDEIGRVFTENRVEHLKHWNVVADELMTRANKLEEDIETVGAGECDISPEESKALHYFPKGFDVTQKFAELKSIRAGSDATYFSDVAAYPELSISPDILIKNYIEVSKELDGGLGKHVEQTFSDFSSKDYDPHKWQGAAGFVVAGYKKPDGSTRNPWMQLNIPENAPQFAFTPAHEGGHCWESHIYKQEESAIHGADQYKNDKTSEIVSWFSELVTYDRVKNSPDLTDEQKANLTEIRTNRDVIGGLNGVSNYLFDAAAYGQRAVKGTALNESEMQKIWMDSQRRLFGEEAVFPKGYENMWSRGRTTTMPFHEGLYPVGAVVAYAMFAKYKSPEYVNDKKKFYQEVMQPTIRKMSYASPAELVQEMGYENLEQATDAFLDTLRERVVEYAEVVQNENEISTVIDPNKVQRVQNIMTDLQQGFDRGIG